MNFLKSMIQKTSTPQKLTRKMSQTNISFARILEKEEEEELDRPDLAKAKAKADATSVRDVDENGNYKFYKLTCPDEDLNKYGIGLFLYFDFLKKAAYVFFLMFVMALPAFISNINGNGVTFKTQLARKTRFTKILWFT